MNDRQFVRMMADILATNSVTDLETHAGADEPVAAVDFAALTIRPEMMTYAYWLRLGYRRFARCRAVRAAYIEQNLSVFAHFTDLRTFPVRNSVPTARSRLRGMVRPASD